jgi:hypothetical protein
MSEIKNIAAGQRFGRLTVLRLVPGMSGRGACWKCECECGGQAVVYGYSLRNGTAKSCGCLIKERLRRGLNYKHGLRRHALYEAWKTMIKRCEKPSHVKYRYYGALGVKVHPRWRQSFPAFLEDVGERPAPGMTLDRINPYGNYEPSNVRWATPLQQAQNRRPRVRVYRLVSVVRQAA